MNWRVCPTHYSISIFAFLWLLYLHLNFCLYLNLCTCICILVVEGCMTWRALTVCSTVHGSLLRQWCVSTQPVLETVQIYINHNSRTGCRPVNQLCNSALCGADTVWMTYWRLTCRANASLKFIGEEEEDPDGDMKSVSVQCWTHVGEKLTGLQVRLFAAAWWEGAPDNGVRGVTTLTGGGVAHRHDLCYTAADGCTVARRMTLVFVPTNATCISLDCLISSKGIGNMCQSDTKLRQRVVHAQCGGWWW